MNECMKRGMYFTDEDIDVQRKLSICPLLQIRLLFLGTLRDLNISSMVYEGFTHFRIFRLPQCRESNHTSQVT